MKKSQIHMMETIVVLFIFFILVFFGIIFYTRIAKTNIEQKIEQFEDLAKIEVAQVASTLPELQCSQENIIRTNCVDILKVESASTLMQSNANNYFDLFGFSTIRIQEVFPLTNEWTIYDREPDDWDTKLPTYFPISLYDPIAQNYYFGVLVVEVYT